MSIITEQTFETALVKSLIENGGYTFGNSDNYNPNLGFFQNELISFIKDTQPKNWEKLSIIHGLDVENKLIKRLIDEINLRGSLDVIRNGFIDYGIKFRLAYFKPETAMNVETILLYNKNRLAVYRQLYFSSDNKNSVDIVLALNGIPIVTIELKNPFTGQNTDNAIKQYNETRDSRELLFAFNKRTLVHFAVDSDDVYMTSKLKGKDTFWLPFNKGYNKGKGNPPNPSGYKTDYLWKEILVKDSLLEILQRFLHLQVEYFDIDNKKAKKETLIFPRYHQLDVVRDIEKFVKEKGAGNNYLIQHSAGSGKSNSIAWLSYRLSNLHNSKDEKYFDSVIVITDRNVLDSQLQETIYQFEHKSGVVQRIDKDSTQLANALISGSQIIITTLQKFPFILEKVGSLSSKKYAVIIDEAHSSQSGEAHKKMKEALRANDIIPDEIEDDDYTAGDEIEAEIEKSAMSRGKQKNISFFAFTATPKYKTLAIFGTSDESDKPAPNHLYSMRQAIEEGFILDVLLNYTDYKRYFNLSKAIEDDPKLNKKKAAIAIANFVNFHPHNLSQKTQIVIEHFRQIVSKKIGGKAKAMFITSSRKLAVRYYDEFNKYIRKMGYEKEMKILVAFSGSVIDDNYPDGITEPQLTKFGEKELPKIFNKDEYKILLVADKYQTGFDQPLLHTMYVDKKLSGIKAVQTLSRLNRTTYGKEDTFVLDFVNDRQVILDSFQPYYEQTTVSQELDINHLFDLKAKLDEKQIYWKSEIEIFGKVFFKPTAKFNHNDQALLYSYIQPAVDRYNAIPNEEEQDEFKKSLRTWVNLYAFLAQIMPFVEKDFEVFYAYAKLLLIKLPKTGSSGGVNINEEVILTYYRLDKINEEAIVLEKNKVGELDGITEAGIKRSKEDKVPLSEIIDILNERFGTEFDDADRLFFEQMEVELANDEKLQTQGKANPIDTFKYAFDDAFINTLIDRMGQNQDIFDKIIGNKEFGETVKNEMLRSVYRRINIQSSEFLA